MSITKLIYYLKNIFQMKEDFKFNLKWIIKKENKLTSNANNEFGVVYDLIQDLLMLLQSIKGFSTKNKISFQFETQIMKDIPLVILNIIRRHYVVAFMTLRRVLESFSLFVYSMENYNEEDYIIHKDNKQIIEFKDNVLKKSYTFFKSKFPKDSERLEGYKDIINSYYSHSNIFASQYNIGKENMRIKSSIFDNYSNENIRTSLVIVSEIICIILTIYDKLYDEYKLFSLEKDFKNKLSICLKKQKKSKIMKERQ